MSVLERIVYIDAHIRGDGYVRLKDVQDHFEVSERQLRRDIHQMRDVYNAPICYDTKRNVYFYSNTNYDKLKFANEKALLFYVFAQAAAGTLAYIPFFSDNPLNGLLDQIPKVDKTIIGSIRYELPEFERATPGLYDNLSIILTSIRDRKRISAEYMDAEGRKAGHSLEPLMLVNYAGTWYCAAIDVECSQKRIYKLSRFGAIVQTKDDYSSSLSPDEIAHFLDSSYGMFKGEGDKTAVVRFYGRARNIVSDEIWNRRQQQKEGEDPVRGPYLELSLPVSQYEELLGRILRFGPEAEPIAPADFREAWKTAIRKMADLARKD